jgi:hypothetical protein
MKLSDVILEFKEKGVSEVNALKQIKARVSAAGGAWNPLKTKMFNLLWNGDESEPAVKAPVKKAAIAPTPTAKKVLSPIEKFKQQNKTAVPAEKPQQSVVKPASRVPGEPTMFNSGTASSVNLLLTFGLSLIAWIQGKKMAEMRPVLEKNKPVLDAFIKQIKMDSKDYAILLNLILDAKKYNPANRGSTVLNFGLAIKKVFPIFESREYQVPPARLALLKSVGAYLRSAKRTENQYKLLVNKAGLVKVPELNALFGSDVENRIPKLNTSDLTAKYDRWLSLNKKFGGNKYHIIPLENKSKLKDAGNKEWEEYTLLNKELKVRYDNIIKSLVYSKGETLVGSNHTTMDVEEVKAYLKTIGMSWSAIPVGFVGRIDSDAKLCTKQGWRIDAPMGGVVVMDKGNNYNPKTGEGYYCQGIRPNGKQQRCYSERHTAPGGHRDASKLEIVDNFIKNETAYRAKWLKLIKAGNTDAPNYTHAVMMEVMYQLAPRPGSSDTGGSNTHFEEPTKGFTYLIKSDVHVFADKIVLDYFDKNGRQVLTLHKAGIPNEQTPVDAKLLYTAVKHFYTQAKTKDSFMWVEPNGKNVKYSELSKYAKTVAPGFKLHKFRHVKATKIAMGILDTCPLKVGKAQSPELSAYYMDAMTKVGAELGHRNKDKVSPTQAIKSYVSKTVSRNFFHRYNVIESPQIAKAINSEETTAASTDIKINVRQKSK